MYVHIRSSLSNYSDFFSGLEKASEINKNGSLEIAKKGLEESWKKIQNYNCLRERQFTN